MPLDTGEKCKTKAIVNSTEEGLQETIEICVIPALVWDLLTGSHYPFANR